LKEHFVTKKFQKIPLRRWKKQFRTSFSRFGHPVTVNTS